MTLVYGGGVYQPVSRAFGLGVDQVSLQRTRGKVPCSRWTESRRVSCSIVGPHQRTLGLGLVTLSIFPIRLSTTR